MSRHFMATLLLVVTLVSVGVAQVVPQVVRVTGSVMSDQIITKVAPEYPPLARQARIQGQVILKAHISKTGDVENLQLISGHPMLAPAAIEAVKQWKYRPFLLNGEPVKVETNVTVNFTLADKPAAEGEGVAGDVPGGIPGGIPGDHASGVIGVVSNTPNGATRVRVSSGVAQGLLIKKVAPQYPADAREQHIQGVVVLRALIDKEGSVASAQVVTGPPELAPAAIEAVKQWKYRPYLLNGTPVIVDTQIQVNFTLVP
jgi:TonB family protein